ncbi:MAG: GntR family transcriptional regulator [Microbacterium sp.]|uniref:GntR family transcriptional regulator n=1 Tax=Microbacterium sp. TaxID=51671 RepID=UPI0039E3B3F7
MRLDPLTSRTQTADDPVHRALLGVVRQAAASGEALPNEYDLAERIGCSRQQVRNALSALEAAGILRRRQGAPTTVDPLGLQMSVRLEDQFEHTELLARLGHRASVELLENEPARLPARIAALLGVPESAPALRTLKRWSADDRPVMLAEGYLLLPDAADAHRDMPSSVFAAVSALWGEPIIWDVTTPGAASLDAETAALLRMDPGAATLTLELVGVAASGRRLFYAFEHHDPAVVRYSLVRTVRPPWGLI